MKVSTIQLILAVQVARAAWAHDKSAMITILVFMALFALLVTIFDSKD